MPSFCDEIDSIAPGLWNKFCLHEGDESRFWKSKLDGHIPCLDRDWRKIVFRFFDYFATSLRLLNSLSHNGRRLETVVYPFRFYYGQIFTYPELVGSRVDAFSGIKWSRSSCCMENFNDTWPWPAYTLARSLSRDSDLETEANTVLNDLEARKRELASDWATFRECLGRADIHDLGRTVFTCMNSYPRKELLRDNQLQKMLSMIQNLIERKTGNSAVLRKILIDIVDECNVLPDCLKVAGITWDPVSGANRVNTSGGFADIYKGNLNGQTVALKMLRSNDSDVKLLFREAIVWRQISHERVLPFYGICNTLFPELHCTMLVSPWKELGDLSGFCHHEKKREFKGIDFMQQIIEGLQYLHNQDPQIIHGDLRGSNVLVEQVGDTSYSLLLTDFGIAEVTNIATTMTEKEPKGTLRWMAPEVINPPEGKHSTSTASSDIYSFAMTCVEIFSGRIPFGKHRQTVNVLHRIIVGERPDNMCDDPLAQERGLDHSIWSLIQRCWDTDHTQRPRTSEILEDIEALKAISSLEDILPKTTQNAVLSSFNKKDTGLKLRSGGIPKEPSEEARVIAETQSGVQLASSVGGNRRNQSPKAREGAAENVQFDDEKIHEASNSLSKFHGHRTLDLGLPNPRELQTSTNPSPSQNQRKSPVIQPLRSVDDTYEDPTDTKSNDQDDSAESSSEDNYVPVERANGRIRLSPTLQLKHRISR